MAAQHAVIRRADQFREQKDLQLDPHAHRATAKAKCREAPVRRNTTPPKAGHRAAEQSGVFGFLREPKIHDSPHFAAAAAEPFGVVGD